MARDTSNEPDYDNTDLEDSDEEIEFEETEEDRRFIVNEDDDESGDEQGQEKFIQSPSKNNNIINNNNSNDDDGSHSRKKKRKHRVHIEEEIGEDDLDFVEENTGIQLKERRKFKRLKKRSAINDLDEEFGELPPLGLKAPRDVKNIFDDDNETDGFEAEDNDDFVVSDDEDQLSDGNEVFSRRQKPTSSLRRQRDDQDSDFVVYETECDSLIPDDSEYKWALDKLTQKCSTTNSSKDSDRRNLKKIGRQELDIKITDVFEPSEVASKMLTEGDEKIRLVDIPERLQYLKLTLADENDLETATKWCELKLRRSKSDIEPFTPERLFAIRTVLLFICKNRLEVSFITRHRKDYWHPFLKEEDLWLIRYECEPLQAYFEQLNKIYNTHYMRLPVKDAEFESNFWSFSQDNVGLNDLADYLMFFHGSELRKLISSDQGSKFRQPAKFDQFEAMRNSSVDDLISLFCLKTSDFTKNIQTEVQINLPSNPSNSSLDSSIKKLVPESVSCDLYKKLFLKYLGHRLFYSPFLRNHYRRGYMTSGIISITPTALGKATITPGHQFFRFKYLTNKPIAMLADEEYLEYLDGENMGLLNIEIELENHLTFRNNLCSLYSLSVTDDWNSARIEIINIADGLLSENSAKYIREKLRKQASEYVLKKCYQRFLHIVDYAPYFAKTQYMIPNDEVPAIIGLTIGNAARGVLVFGAVIDKNGVALHHFTEDLQLKHFGAILDRFSPHVVVLGVCQNYLYRKVLELVQMACSRTGAQVQSISEEVAIIFENSEAALIEFPDLASPLRRAIGVARNVQSPFDLLAGLFPKDILRLNLHQKQNHVPESDILLTLEQAMIQSVSISGFDVNTALLIPCLSNAFQFIPGLGPRKADGIRKRILKIGNLGSRRRLMIDKIVGDCVYTNCASFMRIDPTTVEADKFNPLDNTRIHPLDYELAYKMSKDALEIDEAEENDQACSNMVKQLISGDVTLLDDLVLEDYAKMIEEKLGRKRRETLEIIKEELKRPYADSRPRVPSLTNQDLFELQCRDTKFKTDMLVEATVTLLKDKFIKVRLDKEGLDGIVWKRNIDPAEIGQMRPGFRVQGTIKQIDPERLSVSLSLLPEDISESKDRQERDVDFYFDLVKYRREASGKKLSNHTIQVPVFGIKHPLFKSINAAGAIKYLQGHETGQAVIRPSESHDPQNGNSASMRLAISWVVVGDIIQHLEILHDPKNKKYHILNGEGGPNGEQYHDIDEILFRYIESCAKQVAKVTAFRKYENISPDQMKLKLLRDLDADPSTVAYGIAPNEQFPGYFRIQYALKNRVLNETGFKVLPKKFIYLHHEYATVEQVITAFKNGFNAPT